MSRRTVCFLNVRAAKRPGDCELGRHRHVSVEDAVDMVRSGTAAWEATGAIRAKSAQTSLNRLSIKVGEQLAIMIYRGNRIAIAMLGEIRRKA